MAAVCSTLSRLSLAECGLTFLLLFPTQADRYTRPLQVGNENVVRCMRFDVQHSELIKRLRCMICRQRFGKGGAFSAHLSGVHGVDPNCQELMVARNAKQRCPECFRWCENLETHGLRFCPIQMLAFPGVPWIIRMSRIKSDEDFVLEVREFLCSADGGACQPIVADFHVGDIWTIINTERALDEDFAARHWSTGQPSFRKMKPPSNYLSLLLPRRQRKLLASYDLLLRFLEGYFFDGKMLIGVLEYHRRMVHLNAMRESQRAELRELNTRPSNQARPESRDPLARLSMWLVLSNCRTNAIKHLGRQLPKLGHRVRLEPKVGIHHVSNIGHFLGVCVHLAGAGNSWWVAATLKVRHLRAARRGPRLCGACETYTHNFRTHYFTGQCPDVLEMYYNVPWSEWPPVNGWMVDNYRDNVAAPIFMSSRLLLAAQGYAEAFGLGEDDFAFPANLVETRVPMDFTEHGRPIVSAICGPGRLARIESELKEPIGSDFFRSFTRDPSIHVLAKIKELCIRCNNALHDWQCDNPNVPPPSPYD